MATRVEPQLELDRSEAAGRELSRAARQPDARGDRGRRSRKDEPLTPQQRLDVYQREANYGQVMRIALVMGLVALDLALIVQLTGGAQPVLLGYLAFVCMLFFFGSGVVKHYRALYRIQRHRRQAWPPPFVGMMLAPFGVGLRGDRLDRALLRATAVLALVLLAALIPTQLRHH